MDSFPHSRNENVIVTSRVSYGCGTPPSSLLEHGRQRGVIEAVADALVGRMAPRRGEPDGPLEVGEIHQDQLDSAGGKGRIIVVRVLPNDAARTREVRVHDAGAAGRGRPLQVKGLERDVGRGGTDKYRVLGIGEFPTLEVQKPAWILRQHLPQHLFLNSLLQQKGGKSCQAVDGPAIANLAIIRAEN